MNITFIYVDAYCLYLFVPSKQNLKACILVKNSIMYLYMKSQ